VWLKRYLSLPYCDAVELGLNLEHHDKNPDLRAAVVFEGTHEWIPVLDQLVLVDQKEFAFVMKTQLI
jgi:hypothetical protein